jgi:hypothetical protein
MTKRQLIQFADSYLYSTVNRRGTVQFLAFNQKKQENEENRRVNNSVLVKEKVVLFIKLYTISTQYTLTLHSTSTARWSG